jgi:hypothetical protein
MIPYRNRADHIEETEQDEGVAILLASLTTRKHKIIFLTFHQTITGNNSNPSTSEKTNSCANSEEKVRSIRYAIPHGRHTRQIRSTRQPRGWEHTTVFQPSYLFRRKVYLQITNLFDRASTVLFQKLDDLATERSVVKDQTPVVVLVFMFNH